jgi:hypothetical protein
MTEADFIIIATVIAVTGVIVVGVILNAPGRQDLHRKQSRPERR